jgi:hypothetical protein
MLDLTGHMIIWGGLFAHGDGSTGLMKVVFCYALPTVVQGIGTRPWNCLNSLFLVKMLYNSGSMWPSVVVYEHWPVSQRMIVEMGDYACSEHIVTVFLACQISKLLSYRSGNSSPKNGLGVLCEAWRGVLQNFTINAVDILVIDLYALHIRTIGDIAGHGIV